jgi:hypothetical protein
MGQPEQKLNQRIMELLPPADLPGASGLVSSVYLGNNRSRSGVRVNMRLRLGGVLRLLTVVGGIVFVFYVTAWMSLAYEIHRASQLATSVRAVKVGDSEDSLRPLLDRYRGFRWNEQLGALEDYNYVFEINPWRFPTFLNLRSAPIGNGLNRRFRRAIALRQWMVESEISHQCDPRRSRSSRLQNHPQLCI